MPHIVQSHRAALHALLSHTAKAITMVTLNYIYKYVTSAMHETYPGLLPEAVINTFNPVNAIGVSTYLHDVRDFAEEYWSRYIDPFSFALGLSLSAGSFAKNVAYSIYDFNFADSIQNLDLQGTIKPFLKYSIKGMCYANISSSPLCNFLEELSNASLKYSFSDDISTQSGLAKGFIALEFSRQVSNFLDQHSLPTFFRAYFQSIIIGLGMQILEYPHTDTKPQEISADWELAIPEKCSDIVNHTIEYTMLNLSYGLPLGTSPDSRYIENDTCFLQAELSGFISDPIYCY